METVIWYLLTETACDSPYSGGMVCLEKRCISKMDDLLIKTCLSHFFTTRDVFLLTREIFLKNTQLGIIIRLEIGTL